MAALSSSGHAKSRCLAVCDPLTRLYQGIQLPPDSGEDNLVFPRVYLLNGEDGGISISNFRLFSRCWGGFHRACVFSTVDGGDWRFLLPSEEELDPVCNAHFAGRVDGCLYLGMTWGSLMVLDNASLEFSKVDLPSCQDISDCKGAGWTYIVVHCDFEFGSTPESRIVKVYYDELEVFGRVHGSGEWVLEHSVHQLWEVTQGLSGFPEEKLIDWWQARVIPSAGSGFVIVPVANRDGRTRSLFSVDVETVELAAVLESSYHDTWDTWSSALRWPSFIRECPWV
jgi:hypothetical protein